MLDHRTDLLATLHAIVGLPVVPPTSAALTGPRPAHTRDEDCDVDPETDACRGCGVWHGSPCLVCGGAGFHRDYCPENDR